MILKGIDSQKPGDGSTLIGYVLQVNLAIPLDLLPETKSDKNEQKRTKKNT
jgi:hypothetical protein